MQIRTDEATQTYLPETAPTTGSSDDFNALFDQSIETSSTSSNPLSNGDFIVMDGTMLEKASVGNFLTDDDQNILGNNGSFEGPEGQLAMAVAWARQEGALTGPLTDEALDQIAQNPIVGGMINSSVIAQVKARLAEQQAA